MLLSIITINKNNASGLDKTIQSVINQTFHDYEYIIIDGNSDDKSVKIIEQYRNKIDQVVSEPDKGIYDAMNKGLELATGKYCLFLNSGDYLFSNIVIDKIFQELKNEDIFYGNLYLDKNGNLEPFTYTKSLSINYLLENGIPHQATFIKRILFKSVGFYNTEFKIVSDWFWTLKCFVNQDVTYRHAEIFCSVIDISGISFDPENQLLIQNEKHSAKKMLFSKYMREYFKYSHELESENIMLKNNILYKFHKKVVFLKRWIYNNVSRIRFNKENLQNKDFTIICNNCIAGVIYHNFDLEFKSPTINLFFFSPDYIKFLENFEFYINQELNFVKKSKYFDEKPSYPIGLLFDIEVHFLHYTSEKEAYIKWNKRIDRINKNNLFIIGSDKDLCQFDHIERFDKLQFKNKIFFSAKNYPSLKSVIHIEKYNNRTEIGDLIERQEWLNYIDLITWLNTGKIKKYFLKKYLFRIIFD